MKRTSPANSSSSSIIACAFFKFGLFDCVSPLYATEGILVSAGLAIVMLVQKVASPHSAVLVKIQNDPPVYRNRERFPDGVAVKDTLIFRMDAPLFFANADSFKDEVSALAAAARVVVVHGEAVHV
jgi:SulP family sulfate permease